MAGARISRSLTHSWTRQKKYASLNGDPLTDRTWQMSNVSTILGPEFQTGILVDAAEKELSFEGESKPAIPTAVIQIK